MDAVVFDAHMGASGDMVLGALIDAGADPARLEPLEAGLDVEYVIERGTSSGVAGVDVAVQCQSPQSPRSPEAVIDRIEDLNLPSRLVDRATAIVNRLASAEQSVHGDPDGHFHEVGADDAIADICGAVVLVDDLDPSSVIVGPIATGAGSVETAHGCYPVPTPAVVEIAAASGLRLDSGPVEAELLTPTGAAILAQLAVARDALPSLTIDGVGYGLGDRHFPDRPNALRCLVGTVSGGLHREPVTLLETVVDDVTPETLGSLQSTLADVGARDVTILPTTMKKSRPGHLVQVIVRPDTADRVATQLARETGTLGVREVPMTHRWVADRRIETVDIEVDGRSFEVDVKVATSPDGEIIDVSPEADDVEAVAASVHRPVRAIRRLTREAYNQAD